MRTIGHMTNIEPRHMRTIGHMTNIEPRHMRTIGHMTNIEYGMRQKDDITNTDTQQNDCKASVHTLHR